MSSAQLLSGQPTRRSHNQRKTWINCPRLSINISVTFALNPAVLFRLNAAISCTMAQHLLVSANVNVGNYLCCKVLNRHENFLAKNLYFNPWMQIGGGGFRFESHGELDFLRFESETSPSPRIIISHGQHLVWDLSLKTPYKNWNISWETRTIWEC